MKFYCVIDIYVYYKNDTINIGTHVHLKLTRILKYVYRVKYNIQDYLVFTYLSV